MSLELLAKGDFDLAGTNGFLPVPDTNADNVLWDSALSLATPLRNLEEINFLLFADKANATGVKFKTIISGDTVDKTDTTAVVANTILEITHKIVSPRLIITYNPGAVALGAFRLSIMGRKAR